MPAPDLGTTHAEGHVSAMVAPSRTYTLEPVLRAPVAYAPLVYLEGEDIYTVRARLFRRSDLTTAVAEFANARDRKWMTELNGPGSGSLTVQNDDSDLAAVQDGDVIRFDYRNVAALMVLARERNSTSISSDEERGQATTLAGPGSLAMLDEAVIYPSRGVGSLPPEENRQFSWMAPDYDDSNWPAAVVVTDIATAQATWELRPFADKFPSGSGASVIWDRATAEDAAPPGDCYFRTTYTSTGGALIYAVHDDGGEVFFDGQQVLGFEGGFAEARTVVVQASSGSHTVAGHAQNGPGGADPPPFDNPAGFALAIYPCDANGTATSTTPDLVTNSSWKISAYPPAGPPGMTPGEVIRLVVEEAQARGALAGLVLDFTDDFDSDGNEWPRVTDIATKVGSDYLTFVKEIVATYIDVAMAPAEFRLYAWNQGAAGVDTSVTLTAPTDATDPLSGNLAGLTHKRLI